MRAHRDGEDKTILRTVVVNLKSHHDCTEYWPPTDVTPVISPLLDEASAMPDPENARANNPKSSHAAPLLELATCFA